MRGDLAILATRSMTDYAARVSHYLHSSRELPGCSADEACAAQLKCVQFADGEMEVEVINTLRGKDVFLFAGCGRNAAGIGVNEAKIELYHSIDAIKRCGAERITLFEPYLSASRSDRTNRRNSVGFWVHAKTLISLGVDHILTYQLHSDKSKSSIDPALCAIDDIPATQLLMEYLAGAFVKNQAALESVVQSCWLFCSVDAGGEKLAKRYARAFGSRLVISHKQRNYETQNSVESITLLTDTELRGKEAWIVDDMVDTGGSVLALARELRRRGVARISIAVIHGVFSPPAAERLAALHAEGVLENLVCLDTVEITPELKAALPFLHVVSSARHSAEIVMRLHNQQSLSPLFVDFDAAEHFKSLQLFY